MNFRAISSEYQEDQNRTQVIKYAGINHVDWKIVAGFLNGKMEAKFPFDSWLGSFRGRG